MPTHLECARSAIDRADGVQAATQRHGELLADAIRALVMHVELEQRARRGTGLVPVPPGEAWKPGLADKLDGDPAA